MPIINILQIKWKIFIDCRIYYSCYNHKPPINNSPYAEVIQKAKFLLLVNLGPVWLLSAS